MDEESHGDMCGYEGEGGLRGSMDDLKARNDMCGGE